jgi:hypothetical protein
MGKKHRSAIAELEGPTVPEPRHPAKGHRWLSERKKQDGIDTFWDVLSQRKRQILKLAATVTKKMQEIQIQISRTQKGNFS